MGRRAFLLLALLTFVFRLTAQENNNLQEKFLDAEYFLMKEAYPDALVNYLQLYEKYPDNSNLAYCAGICYLNIPGKKSLAVKYLEAAAKNMSAEHKEGILTQTAAPFDALFYLATAYRINYRFGDAKETFEKYLGSLSPDDHVNQNFTRHEIRICDTAKDLINEPVRLSEENMGEVFNDEKSNFNPVISANGKAFAFMVSLKFYDAVMFSKLIDGKWSAPENITPELQSDGDFYISCLSSDGSTLLLSRDDSYNSDIYFSILKGDSWSKCLRLNKNINTKYWESHGFISEDGSELVFASDRPGGTGGLDIYISHKVHGDWGPAANLGPVINTEFNEDRPFLINNGKTLFFSSQGHENIGGYDLFRSDLQADGTWSKPKNLGYPLNTPDDDIFFMPVDGGRSGYRALMKEGEGYGKEDIYKVTIR
jgi:tetratricopeptide (TPR) repeat protein